MAGNVGVEGDLSQPACVTPRDTFPPAAPSGLAAVPTPGQISLIWEANAETDLAGYIILRGEAPDGELQPLTSEPIRETSYRDATVQPGTRYIYAIVAVDTATPPNASEQSARAEETAR
jgi:fibronectin type 3 domain-containing protein